MRNVADESCREIKTYLIFNNAVFKRTVYERRFKPERPQIALHAG
jgi:hypothetical protein